MIDLKNIDPALHQRLSLPVPMGTDEGGWYHHRDCLTELTGIKKVQVLEPHLEIGPETCCEMLLAQELGLPPHTVGCALNLLRISQEDDTHPVRLSVARGEVAGIEALLPVLSSLAAATNAVLDDCQKELDDWVSRHGEECLDLLVSFISVGHLYTKDRLLWNRLGFTSEVARPLPASELLLNATADEVVLLDQLLSEHESRLRPAGEFLFWAPDTALTRLGFGGYHMEALKRYRVRDQSYRLPCALLELVNSTPTYLESSYTWALLEPGDDAAVLESAAVLLADGMKSASQALELARAF